MDQRKENNSRWPYGASTGTGHAGASGQLGTRESLKYGFPATQHQTRAACAPFCKEGVGRGDLRSEETRIAAARKAIGPDVLLMLDANNAWYDVPTALRYMERFAPYDPYWIEEPFGPDQIDNHAKLAAAIAIPVATGEILAGGWPFKELLEKQAASIP